MLFIASSGRVHGLEVAKILQRKALNAHASQRDYAQENMLTGVEKARLYMKALHQMAKHFEKTSSFDAGLEPSITSLTGSTFDKFVVSSSFALVNF